MEFRGVLWKKSKSKRARRNFTAEYKLNVVDLVTQGEKSVNEISRDLDLSEAVVRC